MRKQPPHSKGASPEPLDDFALGEPPELPKLRPRFSGGISFVGEAAGASASEPPASVISALMQAGLRAGAPSSGVSEASSFGGIYGCPVCSVGEAHTAESGAPSVSESAPRRSMNSDAASKSGEGETHPAATF